MTAKVDFNWAALEKYLDAHPYIQFSLTRARGANLARGKHLWQAVLFKETGAVVFRTQDPDRTTALNTLLKGVST